MAQIKRTQLGQTGMEITRVGFGAWAIGGGGWGLAWGPQEDRESIDTIHRALELWVNWIDTAAAYGFGHPEEVVGRALARLDERPYVFTEASLVRGPGGRVHHSLKRDSILREAASPVRLGVEAIDLSMARSSGHEHTDIAALFRLLVDLAHPTNRAAAS